MSQSDDELQSSALAACAGYFGSGEIGAFSAQAVAEALDVDVAEAVRVLGNLKARGLIDFHRSGDISTSLVTAVTRAGLAVVDAS